MRSTRSGTVAGAVAVGVPTLAAGPAAARASVGAFIGAGPPVHYAPPPPPPVPRFHYAPPPAYHHWPY